MIQALTDLVSFEFWRYAIAGGLAIALVCSVLSVYVVLRRMAFIGQGISHAAFGGIALGIYLFAGSAHATVGIYGVSLAFCLIVAWLIAATTRESRVSEDSAIGIFFVVAMALGVIFFKAARGYNQDAMSYLFGSVLALTRTELWLIVSLGTLVLVPLFVFQKQLLYYCFDMQMAEVSGVPVRWLHYLLLTLLTITIVISVRLVGIILVSAFLVLPGATAHLMAKRFSGMLAASVFIGLATTLGGLISSCLTDWPAGATIVLIQFMMFLSVFAFHRLRYRHVA